MTGENFIGSSRSAQGTESFRAFGPAKGETLAVDFTFATGDELRSALALAQQDFATYQQVSASARAAFLDAIAEEIMQLGDELLNRCCEESGLPLARVTGERGRTCGQLKLFAQLLRDGWWVDARIDTAQPDRQPAARPDIRRMLIPLGPVAVFGASNFPLAFSTAGGDTASALAAGCTVVVKAHPLHPGTNELVSAAVVRAAQRTGMPAGVFSSLHLNDALAVQLVREPAIRAVGFTGSRRVGMTLFQAALSRPDPIPVYAEMSAVNPMVLLNDALARRGQQIARELAGSVALGAGQFCTNPGLVFLVDSDASKSFLDAFAQAISATPTATMLGKNIHDAYVSGVDQLRKKDGVTLLAAAAPAQGSSCQAQATAHLISGAGFLSDGFFSHEIFGPATLVIVCADEAELVRALASIEGQLTASIHATAQDGDLLSKLMPVITAKAGRIIYGGYPTGVEVCHAMQHGGPFPATTDARSTSVGTAAIQRFVRPVAYQDMPDHLLPQALQRGNPLNILRLHDGSWTTEPG